MARARIIIGALLGLPRRARLTLRYLGWRELAWRLLTFPVRLTPLRRRLGLASLVPDPLGPARAWYRVSGRSVTVVIPTYGDPALTIATVRSVRATTDPKRVRIVVADDGSPEPHRAALGGLAGAEVILGESNAGFSANVNRGLRAAPAGDDVVILNSDMVAHRGWLEGLQHAAYAAGDVGIVGPKLLYPDGTIQSAGSYRNLGAPEWFDHRYRFRPADHGPANVPAPALAMTGACLYVKRAVLDEIGPLDEEYGMGYEDVDLCLRAWEAGHRVVYQPLPQLTHLESKTRGTEQGERELASQRHFWRRWGEFFDRRPVRAPDGGLRIVYVTEDTGVGGGHRVVFEHLNGLAARGHHAELWSLDGPPDWFDLRVPTRTFADYEELGAALDGEDAIKVATWWNTAWPVWRASVRRGVPVYFVQDIETSYYADARMQAEVLASYREEFRYLTTSTWVAERLRELGLDPVASAPGVDLETFRPLEGHERAEGVVLALGRTQPLKNFPLTLAAWRALPEPRPELRLFGVEPGIASDAGVVYEQAPPDARVNELYNEATAFVQTSRHEGFCLPLLEAMAAGAPVVCTDAHGNRDFCRHEVNCLLVDDDPAAVAAGIARVLGDPALRERLAREGRRTAEEHRWERRLDAVAEFFERVAGPVGSRAPG